MAHAAVIVSIVSAVVQTNPPGWQIAYVVKNGGRAPVWLVVDDPLVLRRDGTRIELSFARAKMVPGAKVFGYFDPKVVAIAPGDTVERKVHIAWPLRLDDTFNTEREVAPPPGEYEVTVRIGYGRTPAPPAPRLGEGVEAPVLRWQKEAVSLPVRMQIAR